MTQGGGIRSQELFRRAKEVTPGGVHSPVRAFRAVGGEPFFVSSAQGARLRDVDGNVYVDYVGSWGPAILGHAHPEIVDAVREAAGRGISFGTPHPGEVELASKICELVPSVKKVRFCSSGTEATMSCVRLARGFTRKKKIIKFSGCYHGHSDALLVAAGSGPLTLGRPDSAGVTSGAVQDTLILPFHDREAVRICLEKYGDDLAAILLEPIPANVGLILPEEGYLEFLREQASKVGALLIFDEVMTGFRLGLGGAQGMLGVRPDLTAFGKVIGGGMPVGAFGGRAEIMDQLAPDGPVYQAGTLSGHPLAMAAGIAQLKVLERGGVYERLEKTGREIEEIVRKQLGSAGLDYPWARVGSMFCLFFRGKGERVRDLADAQECDRSAYASFFHKMLEKGVYFPPSQFETCFLSAAHGEEDLEITRASLQSALHRKA
jgi:glutamate-1-semialdehyde 2,1-aminomutase